MPGNITDLIIFFFVLVVIVNNTHKHNILVRWQTSMKKSMKSVILTTAIAIDAKCIY